MLNEQEVLDFMRETAYKPMTVKELEQALSVPDAEAFRELIKLLNRLEGEGKIYRSRHDRYGIPERMNLIRGRLQAHPKGFGFLIPDDRDQPDIHIHANDMKGAMNNDLVLGRIIGKNHAGKLEGEIVKIVQRANEQLVGLIECHESFAFVIPDDKRINKDIFIPKEGMKGAVTGEKVVVRLVKFPEGARTAAEGEVVEILGHKDDPGVDILSIIRKHNLPEAFPEDVMAEAERVPNTISEEELGGRVDLRGTMTVTIDGEDAKDLDDAVEVVRLENGNYRLRVSIADVGYYVKEGSALDREAYNRGCSVYLVDRVIPMLPRRLSNGICSLNPHVDRLTLTCEMEFDDHARLVRHDIYPSVIRTVERMTYTNVRKILVDRDPEMMARYQDLVPYFEQMEELALKLRKARMERGAIDFDFPEAKIIVDENGKPIDIVKRDRTIAEQIIEEFMLAANETVAEHFHWLKVPFIFRVHEDPDSEKLMHFIQFAANFGYMVRGRGNKVHPRALQALLEEIKETPEENVISTVLLRSMKQARYDAESLGHFGLAAEFYTHFTSPIRRYPDLVIHRVIREVLAGGGRLSDARMEKLAERMTDIARQSSERERAAQEAERETDDLKKAEFMLDKIGEEYEGIISGVTSFGMFVMLPNTVEGLIRLSDLHDDYYHYHELQHSLIGERTSKVYRIGDEVKVRVARVSVAEHTIDFELVETRRREKTVSFVDGKPTRKRGKEGRGGRADEPGRGRRTGSDTGASGNGGRSGGGSVGRSGKGGRAGSASGGGKGGGRSGGGKSSAASSFITVWTGSNGGNASAGSGGNGGRKRSGGKNGGGSRKRGR
jgi:ribonuclease R